MEEGQPLEKDHMNNIKKIINNYNIIFIIYIKIFMNNIYIH